MNQKDTRFERDNEENETFQKLKASIASDSTTYSLQPNLNNCCESGSQSQLDYSSRPTVTFNQSTSEATEKGYGQTEVVHRVKNRFSIYFDGASKFKIITSYNCH